MTGKINRQEIIEFIQENFKPEPNINELIIYL